MATTQIPTRRRESTNPNPRNQRNSRRTSKQPSRKPPTASQLVEACHVYVEAMKLRQTFVVDLYNEVSLYVESAWSLVEFAEATMTAKNGRAKLSNVRDPQHVIEFHKELERVKKIDLDEAGRLREQAKDETDMEAKTALHAQIDALLLRKSKPGRPLKLRGFEGAVLVSWTVPTFNAPTKGAYHRVDLPRMVKRHARLCKWIAENALQGEQLERFQLEMFVARWELLDSPQAIFNAKTNSLKELVAAKEGELDAKRAQREAQAAQEAADAPLPPEVDATVADTNEDSEAQAVAS